MLDQQSRITKGCTGVAPLRDIGGCLRHYTANVAPLHNPVNPTVIRLTFAQLMNDTGWHYSIEDGKSNGPISLAALRNAIATGKLSQDDLVWHETLGDWKRIASVPDLLPAKPNATTPPPIPRPPEPTPPPVANPQGGFDSFIDTTRKRVESLGSRVTAPAGTETKTDTWGTVGSIAGAFSGGLLLVGLCFTPMACCAVPVSIAGIVAALFSDNKRLRKIGLIGNSIILFLSLAIVIWISFSMAMALQELDRY